MERPLTLEGVPHFVWADRFQPLHRDGVKEMGIPVFHEDVRPDHGSSKEDSSHPNVEARKRHFCCRQEATWVLLYHLHLNRIHLSEYMHTPEYG